MACIVKELKDAAYARQLQVTLNKSDNNGSICPSRKASSKKKAKTKPKTKTKANGSKKGFESKKKGNQKNKMSGHSRMLLISYHYTLAIPME
jgi:hypothetical protein